LYVLHHLHPDLHAFRAVVRGAVRRRVLPPRTRVSGKRRASTIINLPNPQSIPAISGTFPVPDSEKAG